MSLHRKHSTPVAVRDRRAFDENWRFFRGDPVVAPAQLAYSGLAPHLLNAMRATVGEGATPRLIPRLTRAETSVDSVPFCQPEFDDSEWRLLDLPHDWAIEGPFSLELPGETGKLPWQGVGWYRKRFQLAPIAPDTEVFLELDGAMSFSTIWLNGHRIGGWPYGYTSFRVELTPWLDPAGNNVIVVRLDNPPNSSRWYPGAGLYRHLWLTTVPAVRIAHEGLFVSCPRVSGDAAIVNVDVTLHNSLAVDVEVRLSTVIARLEGDGALLAPEPEAGECVASCLIESGNQTERTLCHQITHPKLWSLTERARYVVAVRLELDGELVDRVECAFGIRTVEFDAEQGFLLNGNRMPIQGVCMHHDLGALGTAVHERALERQIEILQSMGCNAIRTSHNPPAKELLDLCDRMGMLLMVEAFDCWKRGKKTPAGLKEGDPGFRYFDYATVYDDWHDADLRSMVRSCRNHPSVICYSIGNEVIEQWFADGWKYAVHLAGIVREEDRTRAITAGCNGEIAAYRGFQTAIDVIGLNYKPFAYAKLRQDNPTLRLVGSETASTISTRGEYFFPVCDDKAAGQVNFQVSSYDLSAPPWAFPPDQEFLGLDENPFVAGEFVWTGFDYLGEPTPYNADATNLLNFTDPTQRDEAKLELERLGKIVVPARSSYCGIVDLAGFPKDRFYIYQARWRPELRMAHILPHWNWPEREGQVTPVHVYSSADEAELFLNGRSQGRQSRAAKQYRFRWDDVRYEPGELEVVTFRQGKPWATAVRRTTGPAVRLAAHSDRDVIFHGACDLAFVTVRVEDDRGQLVPRSQPQIRCQADGPATIVATDNGDPTNLVSFCSPVRPAHQGLLLVVLRARRGTTGSVRLTLQAPGLEGCEVVLRVTSSA
jgi:beta-galactosidase